MPAVKALARLDEPFVVLLGFSPLDYLLLSLLLLEFGEFLAKHVLSDMAMSVPQASLYSTRVWQSEVIEDQILGSSSVAYGKSVERSCADGIDAQLRKQELNVRIRSPPRFDCGK